MSCVIHEPAAAYHAQAKDFLSSHQLADFRKSPRLYHRKRQGLVPDEDRPAYLIGRAAHCLILEGLDAFEAAYAVGGPINPRTGEPYGASTKAWSEWAATQGKPVLTETQFDCVARMNEAVRTHAEAKQLLATGEAEGVVRTDYRGFPCQIRMDWFDPHVGIVDLKTCDDLTWFEADARRYGYVHQLAFYRAVVAEVVAIAMPAWFIAVEKKEPYRCGVWWIAPEALVDAQSVNEAAMDRLRECLVRDEWPSGYEEPRLFLSV